MQDGNINTLAVNGLTLNGATLNFDLGSTADEISIAGGASLSGVNQVYVAGISGIAAGTYPLITAAGGGLNSGGTFNLDTSSVTVGGNTYNLSLAGSGAGTAEEIGCDGGAERSKHLGGGRQRKLEPDRQLDRPRPQQRGRRGDHQSAHRLALDGYARRGGHPGHAATGRQQSGRATR